MLSKLNCFFKNTKEEQTTIRIVINSLSCSSKEFSESEQIINYFKAKNINVSEIIDLNQDLVFEQSKSTIKIYIDIIFHIYFIIKIKKVFLSNFFLLILKFNKNM